ncbi:MAG: HipA domain-containing protein [Treponema sp.]|nr:HipA domain-containing protein [Treponema sp.]
MKYILYHKNIKVLNFEIINDEVYNINEIYNEEHLPLFLQSEHITNKVRAFREWWKNRCIPASRQNLESFLQKLNGENLNTLIIKSMGLSLSDQYWFKPEISQLKWEDVNFYENDFSEDIGNLFFGIKLNKDIDFVSPDNTSDGCLLKKWIIKDNERFLLKGGSSPYEQEPFNEVLATKICECLSIPHAEYNLVEIKDKYYCSCNNITTKNTELVSAWYIINTRKKDKNINAIEHLINCCKEMNIENEENLKNSLGKMILLDYIIANTDRHYKNFSFLRNSNTLEWIGFAPVFDTGTSMFNKKSTEELKLPYFTDSSNIEAKPFYSKQLKQLEYFSTIIALQDINFTTLKDIPDYYSELLSTNKKISKERRELLVSQLKRRIEHSQSVIYRKNDITKEFLFFIFNDKSKNNILDKISNAMIQISTKGSGYKKIIENYLKVLKPVDEKDMIEKIQKDINYFFMKKRKITPRNQSKS